MADLLITSLEQPLKSWQAAFAKLSCARELPAVKGNKQETPAVIWLHLQDQPQVWLKAMVDDIRLHSPLSKIVVLANVPKPHEAMFALGLGVGAYVHAYINEKTLKEIKDVVLHGGVWLGNDLLQRLIDASLQMVHYDEEAAHEDLLDLLTKREREVALAASKGLSNKEIARVLSITERTVKAHLSSVFETLKVKDRLHLALILHGQQLNQQLATRATLQKKSSYSPVVTLQ